MKMRLGGCQRCRGDVYEHVDREGDLAMVCLQCGGVSYIFTRFTAVDSTGMVWYSTVRSGATDRAGGKMQEA